MSSVCLLRARRNPALQIELRSYIANLTLCIQGILFDLELPGSAVLRVIEYYGSSDDYPPFLEEYDKAEYFERKSFHGEEVD